MMISDPAVKTGFWTNYDLDGESYLWTVSEIWGPIFKILLNIVFALAWPWARAILQRTWLWFTWSWPWLIRKWKDLWYGSGLHDEEEPLLEQPPEQPDDGPNWPLLTWWTPLGKSDFFLAAIIASGAFLYAVAGGAVGEIPADTLGRTNTPKSACGPWDLKRDVDRRVEDFDKLVTAQKEARAAKYGRDCYGSHPVYTPGRCNFFETSQIEYTVEAVDCPFHCTKYRCICANGSFKTARRLSAGSFSARKLGLNGRNLPFVRRTSTFVPLNIDNGFVKQTGNLKFEYYLGPIDSQEGSTNHTFETSGDPFKWNITAYSVSVFESTPSPEQDKWQPTKELQRTKDSYMTAIFISPCQIRYDGRCEDPLFLATDDLSDIDLPNKFYRKDVRARVLIAIDEMEVCRQRDMDCYPSSEAKPEFGIEYEFVRTALRRSSTFHSIENRLGKALVASESLGNFMSPQLDWEQWIIESRALFNTSLARLQFNMLDMATGDHPRGDFESAYENSTPTWAKSDMGRMCDNYRFHMSGHYANIRVRYALLLLLVPIVLFVLTRSTKTPLDDNDPPRINGYYMVFDRCIWWVWKIATWVGIKLRIVSNAMRGLSVRAWKKVTDLMEQCMERCR